MGYSYELHKIARCIRAIISFSLILSWQMKKKKKSFPNQVFYIYLENLLSVDWQISMAYFLVWKHHISGIWEELGGII